MTKKKIIIQTSVSSDLVIKALRRGHIKHTPIITLDGDISAEEEVMNSISKFVGQRCLIRMRRGAVLRGVLVENDGEFIYLKDGEETNCASISNIIFMKVNKQEDSPEFNRR